jgi:adenine-specific DNA-methyltransferase
MKIDYNLAPSDSHIESDERIRSLGSYYTPATTATALAGWAIRTGDEVILEPSAGAGALLRAAFARSESLRNMCSAHAFDIDPNAIRQLRSLAKPEITVFQKDFLSECPAVQPKFDLVLANPPFNRNHSLSPKLRNELRKRFAIKGAVGLWVYFLLHSISFLKGGGRVASIVPRSILFTAHGEAFLQRLCEHFSVVGVYELSSKPQWSNFADEDGAVVLADGYLVGKSETYVKGVLTDQGATEELLADDCPTYQELFRRTVPLDKLAILSIGVVTGKNQVFLMTENERVSAKIAATDVRAVVSRRKQIRGITVTVEEISALAKEGQKTWLLAPTELTKPVEKYLERITKSERKSVVWFKKRTPWWKVQIAERYDAVFTYMNDTGPRIVRLETGVSCTNTLHRIAFRSEVSADEEISAVLTPISTFGQLAAEKMGRSYGGGVLKFEISEAKRFPILTGTQFTMDLLLRVDGMLRIGEVEAATQTVDTAFMPGIFGKDWISAQAALSQELSKLRKLRRGNPKKGG